MCLKMYLNDKFIYYTITIIIYYMREYAKTVQTLQTKKQKNSLDFRHTILNLDTCKTVDFVTA